MKKNKIKIGLVLLCLSGCFFFSMEKKQLTDLTLKNIEALAQGEGPTENYYCIGSGDIDCYGDKVEDMYTGFSLRP